LSVDPTPIDPAVTAVDPGKDDPTPLAVTIPDHDGPIRAGVHDIMDDSVYEEVTEGRGTEFGARLHDFAEAYALGQDVSPDDEELAAVARLIDSLDGTLFPEQTVLCPLEGDPRIVLTGIIDLLHVADDRVDIIDYKTDLSRVAHEEYRTQLSVYWHVLQAEYPDREIRASVYYTADDELVSIHQRAVADLRAIAERRLDTA
jgi:hypothetical protein